MAWCLGEYGNHDQYFAMLYSALNIRYLNFAMPSRSLYYNDSSHACINYDVLHCMSVLNKQLLVLHDGETSMNFYQQLDFIH